MGSVAQWKLDAFQQRKKGHLILPDLSDCAADLAAKMTEIRSAESSINTYRSLHTKFFSFTNITPIQIQFSHVETFNLKIMVGEGYSRSTQRQFIENKFCNIKTTRTPVDNKVYIP